VSGGLPTPGDYRTGARLAAANARRLTRSARRLERFGDFGAAAALYATALEEAVKADVLILLEEESEAASPDHEAILRLLFSDHKTKYRLAAWAIGTAGETEAASVSPLTSSELVGLVGLLLLFIGLMIQMRRGEELPATAPSIDLNVAPFLAELASNADGLETWAAKAFSMRNRGLYVGFVAGSWEHPGLVTREDAREARTAVLPVVRGASRWARAGKALV
jgi:hypothetical protein